MSAPRFHRDDPAQVDRAADRAESIAWAASRLARRDFLIIDTETTGLDELAEVVSIAVLSPAGRVLLDMLIRPLRPIPEDATAIHGLTQDMVANAPSYHEAWPIIHDSLPRWPGERAVIFNAEFDCRILAQTAALYGLTTILPRRHVDCAMIAYSRYQQEWNHYRQAYRWQALPNYPGQYAHHAIDDCRATLRIMHLMANAQ